MITISFNKYTLKTFTCAFFSPYNNLNRIIERLYYLVFTNEETEAQRKTLEKITCGNGAQVSN
jgi:hypothetical protein